MRRIPKSLFSRQRAYQAICNSVALFDEGRVIMEGRGLEVFDILQRSAGSLGRSFEFSSRRREACRPSCILPFLDSTCERFGACLRACEHVARSRASVSHRVHSSVGPFGIRQGYRGCSGVLVVIGVGWADHLNTRHCNHDRVLSLFLIHFLAAVRSASLTLLAYRTVIALPHSLSAPPPQPRSPLPLPAPSSRPDRTRVAVRGIPPDYYHR